LSEVRVAHLAESAIDIDDVLDSVNEKLTRKRESTLETLLLGREETATTSDVFGCPSVLDATVVLGVVEAGQSIEETPITSTSGDGSELSGAIGATSNMTLVPESPVSRLVERHVATFGAHVDEVVEVSILIRKSEESRDLEVVAVRAGGEHRAERGVAGRLKEGTKESPLGQV